MNQLKISVPEYIGTERDMYRQALEISKQWKKLEQGVSELDDCTIQLTDAMNEADPKDLEDDPSR